MRQITKPRRLCSSNTQTRVAKIVHHNQWVAGASPSDPPTYRNPGKEAANALAAAQHRSPAHLNLHACSALLRNIMGSHLARAFARRVRNFLVSSDHRQPTSPEPPTELFREGWPARRGFSPSYAWPQPRLHPRGRPGGAQNRRSAKQTPNKGSPSAKISIRLQSRNMAFVTTLPPASLQMRAPALSTTNPRRPKNPALARSSVVAKIVERTATPTLTCGKGGGGEDGAEGGLGTMATRSE